MDLKKLLQERYLPYSRSIRYILEFSFFVSIILAGLGFGLRQIAMFLIRSSGRVAVSTGDISFLYTTWQGPLLVIIGFVVIYVYFAFDLNSRIVFSSMIIKGKPDIKAALKEGLMSMKSFLTPDGIGIALYIALIVPLTGFGFTISLTDSLYLPDFIYSVIRSNTIYLVLYEMAILGLIFLGVANIFTLHGVLLSGFKPYDADNESRRLMKANWKDFIKSNLRFLLNIVVVVLSLVIILGIIAIIVLLQLTDDPVKVKLFGFFILFLFAEIMFFINSILKSFYLIYMTQLYYRYRSEDYAFVRIENRKKYLMPFFNLALMVFIAFGTSYMFVMYSDELLPTEVKTGIIAHRAGGSEAPENTVTGIEKAIEYGAYGAEIDIQRTKDGYYVVNHDGNFSRLCGNNARPEDLTLDEVKDLIIRDPLFPGQEEEVATLEEMLDASHDRIVLFIELKGNTADRQMADDTVKILRERHMEDECVLISLKYPLIEYIEQKYPDIQTAYLTFYSFGNTAQIPCDYLGLEEEATNGSTIDSVHDTGKKVLVWTPNSENSQKSFLTSNADYIITDKVSQASELVEKLKQRQDWEIILDILIHR